MSVDPLQLVEDRLAEGGYAPRRRQDSIVSRCPAHDDSTPSLGVKRGSTHPLIFKCMAGCSTEDVLTALNLTWADVSTARERVEQRVTARYPYTDETGTLLYTVERLEPGFDGRSKSFKQVPASGKTGQGAMSGIRRVPYRFPAILNAVEKGLPIYLCEGEKDVDALVELGFEATTNAGGANEWRPEWNVHLIKANVLIVADRDIAGYKRALDLYRAMRHIVRDVAVLEPVEGKDVYDHLHAGHNLGELVGLSEGALISKMAALTVTSEPEPVDTHRLDKYLVDWNTVWTMDRSPEWLIEPVIARGRAHSLYAGAKTGKSLLTLYMAATAALGEAAFGLPFNAGKPTNILYLDMEMTVDDLIERLSDMGYDDRPIPNLSYLSLPNLPPLDTPEGGALIVEFALQRNIELVVIDTTSRIISGEENSADTFRYLYMHTIQPLKSAGIASLRLDHSGKDTTKGTRGSSAKSDDVDVVYRMDSTEDGFSLTATHRRMGWIPEVTSLAMREDPLRFHIAAPSVNTKVIEVMELLDMMGLPLDASRRTAEKALKAAGQGRRATDVMAAVRARQRPKPVAHPVDDDSEDLF